MSVQQDSQDTFDVFKLIKAMKDDDAEQIARQFALMPWSAGKDFIPFETALGEAILNSDYKLAERMATFVINHQKKVIKDFKRKHKKYDDVEKLPFWGQFILYGMSDRYYNRLETTPFFKGLVKLVQERIFDPWQCINSAETFIKMIRLGVGQHSSLKFTDKGESLTYYVVMTNKTTVENKMHILRFMKDRELLDLAAYNGLPSPAIAAITHRYRSVWNSVLCRVNQVSQIYDEQGNNLLYYVFKYKVYIKYIILGQKKSTVVKMLCEKNKEGKAMIEYFIVDNKYPEFFFWRGHYNYDKLSYLAFQTLVQNNEFEVLQRLPPIPDAYRDRFSYLFAQYDFPHNTALDQYKQTYALTKRKKFGAEKFVDGSSTTFTFEQLPIEIFEIILADLEPVDVMCLKMSSKGLDTAFNRTKYLTNYFPRSLGTHIDSPTTEFSRRVKLDVKWKRHKYRVRIIKDVPYRLCNAAMNEHWMYTGGDRDVWLYNMHTDQVIEANYRGHYFTEPLLLDSGPVNLPLVAMLNGATAKFTLLRFTTNGQITAYGAAHLDASFAMSPQSKHYEPTYIRQLVGTNIVLGREGAIWNYGVDATVGHLLDQTALTDTSVRDVHANESLIVAATTTGLSLYDHKTFNNIATFDTTEPSLRVYIHNNEVVHLSDSGIHYYDVRTHRLLETVPFIRQYEFGQHMYHVFDSSGTRYIQNYEEGWNVIYNIRERGWESVLFTDGHREMYAINSYALLMDHASLALFD